jgi:D-inositol-3-phosphate glycosyltransferase
MLSIHSSPLARLGGKEAGGMNVYVRELATELAAQGLKIDIFTRMQDATLPPVIALADGVRVVHVPTGPTRPYDKNQILTYLPEFLNRVRCFARSQAAPYDLIHSHYWISGEAALHLRESWGVPVVQMFHTLGAMKNLVARSAEEAETSQRVAIERKLLREADSVVAATHIDRAQMVAHYGAQVDRINIIPCGVDVHRFQPQLQEDARQGLGISPHWQLLLSIGRIEPLKGMDSLIQALALLHKQHPAWRNTLHGMILGGDSDKTPTEQWNSEQRRLNMLCYDLGVADAVMFAGAQPHTALPAYYASADIVVIPSHYESFGMVALEAMACGRPVVASDVGGLSLSIAHGHSGLLIPPDSPALLANTLEQLLTDRHRRDTLGREAHQQMGRYSWQHIASRVHRLYEEVIEDAQQRGVCRYDPHDSPGERSRDTPTRTCHRCPSG